MSEARAIMHTADMVAGDMAENLAGRLRHVSHSKLRRLKRELSQFNAHTGKWKS